MGQETISLFWALEIRNMETVRELLFMRGFPGHLLHLASDMSI